MKIRNKNVNKLLEKYKEIALLGKVNEILSWDLNVNLPSKASEGRARQIAHITKLVTEKWLDPEFRTTLEEANRKSHSTKATRDEKAIIRNLNHAGKYYYKIPKEIIIEFSEATTRAFIVWRKAKLEDKFKDFLPELKRLLRLNRMIAGHLGYKDNPYDALLDLYEPGLTAKKVEKVFSKLQPELTSIIKKIKKSEVHKKQEKLINPDFSYPEQDQKQIALWTLRLMGYDLDAGRMDKSTHPFSTVLGRQDIRITNRYKMDNFVGSIMVAMHECGHALYEQGVDEEYENTPFAGGVSLGIHESQSRFWENQVGRSIDFVQFITPVLHAFYPEQLSKIDSSDFYIHFNMVKPGLIRVEADEVTYNLHIALRFELENALINEKIEPEDLPKIWRSKMKKYLGIIPDTDREGVLQDVHWSHGPMGYFPTYTLGNLYAAQITDTMKNELVLEDLLRRGELGTILSWLRTNIHKHGSLYWPDELIIKITGKKLSPKYFLDYIKKKYSRLYQTSL